MPTDGAVDAQPLYLSGLTIGASARRAVYRDGKRHGVCVDANSDAALWQTSALGAGETAADNQGCSELSSKVGITSTPVIDRNFGPDGAIFFVAKTKDSSGNYHQRLHALDLTTGAELNGSPVEIAATYPANGGRQTPSTRASSSRGSVAGEQRHGVSLLGRRHASRHRSTTTAG